MELKLFEGDYVPDGYGGFETVSGAEEVLQRALCKLSARRGALPLLPDYGSRLYKLMRSPASERNAAALSYVTEALSNEAGLSVKDIESAFDADDRIMLGVKLEYLAEEYGLTLEAIQMAN